MESQVAVCLLSCVIKTGGMGDKGRWWSSGSCDLVVLSLIGVGLEGGLAFGGRFVHPECRSPILYRTAICQGLRLSGRPLRGPAGEGRFL